jgi:hypothetical protein
MSITRPMTVVPFPSWYWWRPAWIRAGSWSRSAWATEIWK